MKVIICGGGSVGENIAYYLSHHGSDVVLIDKDPAKVERLSKTLDLQAICGPSSRPDILEQADANEADMLIAVTPHDEVNIVACQMAQSLFKVPMKIARIRDQHYIDKDYTHVINEHNRQAIDVVISPEREVAAAIFRRLKTPDAFDSLNTADGQATILGLRLSEENPLVNNTQDAWRTIFDDIRFEIIRACRNGQLLSIKPSLRLQAHDEIYLALPSQDVERLMLAMNYNPSQTRQIVIVGGGNIGLALARFTKQSIHDVNLRIIEHNGERARKLSEKLDDTMVIHGNALDPQVLQEANIKACQAMVAVTQEDENNILATLLAKHYGCEHVSALISNRVYSGMVTRIGIDTFVDPRDITISKVLQHIRRGRILSVYTINDPEGEIIEFEALAKSSIVGKSLQNLNLPSDVRVGVLLRGGELIMPDSDSIIQPKDRITLFSPARWIKDIERSFSARFELF